MEERIECNSIVAVRKINFRLRGWEVAKTGSRPCPVESLSFDFLTGILMLVQFCT
jgi:hypothetical protein